MDYAALSSRSWVGPAGARVEAIARTRFKNPLGGRVGCPKSTTTGPPLPDHRARHDRDHTERDSAETNRFIPTASFSVSSVRTRVPIGSALLAAPGVGLCLDGAAPRAHSLVPVSWLLSSREGPLVACALTRVGVPYPAQRARRKSRIACLSGLDSPLKREITAFASDGP